MDFKIVKKTTGLEVVDLKKLSKKQYQDLVKAASAGNSASQLMLARCNHEGSQGVRVCQKKAIKYFEMVLANPTATSEEIANAAGSLGWIHHQGIEVVRDKKKAVGYLTTSLEKDSKHCATRHLLALCYMEGEGVPKVDFTKAIELLEPAKALGHGPSIATLALCYQNGGEGVAKDPGKAFALHLLAAEKGIGAAQFYTGMYLYHGWGGQKVDKVKAAEWIEKAAAQGIVKAQKATAVFYSEGTIVLGNKVTAFYWFKKAADGGDAAACYSVANGFQFGRGTPLSLKDAFYYYELGAKQGHIESIVEECWCHIKGIGTKVNPKKGVPRLTELAHKKHPSALNKLGLCYLEGLGVIAHVPTAIKYLEEAAEKNDPDALQIMGAFYLEGKNVVRDKNRGFQYTERAFKAGNMNAHCNLAVCYWHGWGVAPDPQQAFKLFQLAAKDGIQAAEYYVGIAHLDGTGTHVNKKEAFETFAALAKKENTRGLTMQGICYLRGWGTDITPAAAVKCFQKAAGLNYNDAQIYLGACLLIGHGVEKDPVQALKLFEAVGERDSDAVNNIGWYYLMQGPNFYSKAVDYFKRAERMGNKIARNNLGWCMLNGFGMNVDIQKTKDFFKIALNVAKEKNNDHDDTHLGMGFSCGNGVFALSDVNPLQLFPPKVLGLQLCAMQRNLALCYQNGWGLETDLAYADKLIKTALVLENYIRENEKKKEDEAKAKEAEDRARAEAEALEKAKEAEDRVRAEAEALKKAKAKTETTHAIKTAVESDSDGDSENGLEYDVDEIIALRAQSTVPGTILAPVSNPLTQKPVEKVFIPPLSLDQVRVAAEALEKAKAKEAADRVRAKAEALEKAKAKEAADRVRAEAEALEKAKAKTETTHSIKTPVKPDSQVTIAQPNVNPLKPPIQKLIIDPVKLAECQEEYQKGCEHLRRRHYAGAETQFNYALNLAKNIGADLIAAYCHAGLSEYYHGAALFKKTQNNIPLCVDMLKTALDHCKNAQEIIAKLKSTLLNVDVTEVERFSQKMEVESFSQKMNQLSLILTEQHKVEQTALASFNAHNPPSPAPMGPPQAVQYYYLPQHNVNARPLPVPRMTPPQTVPNGNLGSVKLPRQFR
jgi:TPR repeat protein